MDVDTMSVDLRQMQAIVDAGRRTGRFVEAEVELVGQPAGPATVLARADLYLWWGLELDQVVGVPDQPGYDPATAATAQAKRVRAAQLLGLPGLPEWQAAPLRALLTARSQPDLDEGVCSDTDVRWMLERVTGQLARRRPEAAARLLEQIEERPEDPCLNRIRLLTAHRLDWIRGVPGADTAAAAVLRTVRALRRSREAAARAADLRAELPDLLRRRADLEPLVGRDPLTGVANRFGSDEWFRRHRHDRVGLVMVDLVDFKIVNDRCGHLVGDEVLRRVARSLQEVGDLVARRGGDEFVVAVRDEVDLAGLAARIRQVVAAVPLSDLCPDWTPACRIGSAAGVPERLGQDLMSVADRELVAQKATR